ncbi:MAG: DUF2812 domain-containing protein [Bacteroidales bacterium]|nr:DUF2812 domain-containing protein [Bacteroidales bacterium]MBP3670339.1 DUF2812 domain-containing protein [Bacteroidaceae bacterium]
MEKKHYFRYFTIADYEKEQKWINDMSRHGWNLVKTNGLIYTFERGVPGEYIYKIDLPDEKMSDVEVDTYYKFMEECGVEIVATYKFWRYLRKKSADGAIECADNTMAQLSMVNKAYGLANKLINMLLVIFAVIIILSGVVRAFVSGAVADFVEGFATGISSSAVVALALLFVPISRKLRKRMNELIEELVVKG